MTYPLVSGGGIREKAENVKRERNEGNKGEMRKGKLDLAGFWGRANCMIEPEINLYFLSFYFFPWSVHS